MIFSRLLATIVFQPVLQQTNYSYNNITLLPEGTKKNINTWTNRKFCNIGYEKKMQFGFQKLGSWLTAVFTWQYILLAAKFLVKFPVHTASDYNYWLQILAQTHTHTHTHCFKTRISIRKSCQLHWLCVGFMYFK